MAIDRLKMNTMEGREKILKPLMSIGSFRQEEERKGPVKFFTVRSPP